jgi:hypothetical protein
MTAEELMALALDMEEESPIEWNELNLTRSEAYLMMSHRVLDLFQDMEKEALMATVVKLTVENFALHLKVLRDGDT